MSSVRPYVVIVLGGVFLLLFLLERLVPLREQRRELRGRLLVNGVLTALSFLVAALLVRPAATALLAVDDSTRLGLAWLVDMHPVLRGAVAFLLMDLAFY